MPVGLAPPRAQLADGGDDQIFMSWIANTTFVHVRSILVLRLVVITV